MRTFKIALNKISHKGSMLLERSNADYEFEGVVVHYNPDRVGWLRVDDPAFEKRDIMFFPYDVEKADFDEVKIDMKLRFRPRIEGNETIAGDLEIV